MYEDEINEDAKGEGLREELINTLGKRGEDAVWCEVHIDPMALLPKAEEMVSESVDETKEGDLVVRYDDLVNILQTAEKYGMRYEVNFTKNDIKIYPSPPNPNRE